MTNPVMRSATRAALDALHEEEDAVFEGRVPADTLVSIAGELYSVANLLVAQPRLRRTLGDPATAPDSRAGVADTLLSGNVGRQTLQIVTAAVRQRWSTQWDLVDALEDGADAALFAAAEKQHALDTVEDDLFRLERILESEGDVSALLDELTVGPERRNGLLDSLVGGKVSAVTLDLLHHAVASQRKRSITLAIDDLLEKAAARRDRSVARVTSAVPLTDAQERRLAAVLTEIYGREMSVRTALDPDVQGGLVVRVRDEIIDGSISHAFAQVRAALAS
jgi:F-type H+-transporting ATPase subunit delta